ncbi:o-succinylbenzoate--CoA ligase [Bacillus niameyensis]|uniref:o-succinylbenzoate--CoA ligase n=1 Tax=Bacillus niameyensis TaxID=1522308 RepID=UPI000786777F|nr:o-succinylbenzoate--CoA ligase [Bacillus niameyensis]
MQEAIPNFLLQRAYLTPDRKALVFEERTWTFREMAEIVQEFTKRLASLSIKRHDRVAILMKNRPDMVFIIHALQQIGVDIVFLNFRLTASELQFQLEDSETKVLIYDEDFSKIAEQLQQLKADMNSFTPIQLRTLPLQEIEIRNEFLLDEVCSIMYTSGTTGKPKGVLQSFGNHWWSAVGSSLNLGLRENDAWLCAVPLFHISGMSILMRSIIYGMPVYLMEQFDEKKANQLLCSGQITIMSVVSAMLNRMLDDLDDEGYHSAVRCMLLGGGPAPRPLLEKCVDKGIPIFQTYGMTETSSQIATLSPEDCLKKLGSAGKPLFPAQIKVVDGNGELLEAGQIGEIQLKGPNITAGYLNRPDANASTFDQGWLKTGDLGYLDEEGFLYVVDRRSDLIISGGENIYPAEIEEVLMAHHAVVEAGVTGIDDPTWGQVPYAFVVLKKHAEEKNILQFCDERLARYKIPKRIIQVNTLPRNASNKLLRRELIYYVEGGRSQ